MPSAYRAIHPVFHASKLVTYNESTIPGQKPPPPKPVNIKNTDEWEVEKILQHRIDSRTGKTEYFVRWKGFSRGDNSWEPAENLLNVQEKIQEYLKLEYKPANKRPTRTKRARNIEAEDEILRELLIQDSTQRWSYYAHTRHGKRSWLDVIRKRKHRNWYQHESAGQHRP